MTGRSALISLDQIPVMGGLDDSPRGRVLRAAAYLFRTQGYERTTVRDLAAIIGIQSGSIFHHFKTKEDILCAVMEEAIRFNHARLVEALGRASTDTDRLRALILGELAAINGDTGDAMAVLVYEWTALSEANQKKLLSMRDAYEQLWLDVLTALHQAGKIPVEPFILRRLLAGAIGWTLHWYKRQGPMTLDQLADKVQALVLH